VVGPGFQAPPEESQRTQAVKARQSAVKALGAKRAVRPDRHVDAGRPPTTKRGLERWNSPVHSERGPATAAPADHPGPDLRSIGDSLPRRSSTTQRTAMGPPSPPRSGCSRCQRPRPCRANRTSSSHRFAAVTLPQPSWTNQEPSRRATEIAEDLRLPARESPFCAGRVERRPPEVAGLSLFRKRAGRVRDPPLRAVSGGGRAGDACRRDRGSSEGRAAAVRGLSRWCFVSMVLGGWLVRGCG
jgi:hypothetical protein